VDNPVDRADRLRRQGKTSPKRHEAAIWQESGATAMHRATIRGLHGAVADLARLGTVVVTMATARYW
jgi:hypothetical protein